MRSIALGTLCVAVLAAWSASAAEGATSCGCQAAGPSGTPTVLVCPQGDGPSLADAGAVITLVYTDTEGTPVPGLGPATLVGGCSGGIALCGPHLTSDGVTDATGTTTVSGVIAAGGRDVEIQWSVGNIPEPLCLLQFAVVNLVSPDINGDLAVDVVDFSIFANGYSSPPKAYDARLDYNGDAAVDLLDFALFAQHFGHRCAG